MNQAVPSEAAPQPAPELVTLPFEELYRLHVKFVWRNLRRLGVPEAQVEDAVQEVFLVVHRRRAEFEGRASTRTWLFRVLSRVAADQRRTLRRKSPHQQLPGGPVDPESLTDERGARPDEQRETREARELMYRLLGQLKEDRRAVFLLAELEEMPMAEVAEALELNVNTAYSRLRAARADFEKIVAREQARADWRAR